MTRLHLIVEQPGSQEPMSMQVRDDLPVEQCVSTLVERLRLPTRDSIGTPLTYRLSTVADGRPLPDQQRLRDLHLPSGTRVRLDTTNADYPTVPVLARRPFLQPHIGRRAVLPLLTLSTVGLLSGASTAVAQHVWGHLGTTPPRRTTLRVQQPFRFTAHQAPVRTVAWSPDGTFLCSGADDAVLLLWMPDGTVRQRVALPDAIRAVVWSPDGRRIAAGSGAAVAFVDGQTGHVLARPQAHRAAVTSVVWSGQIGNPVVSSSLDKRAIVWQTQEFQPQGIFTRHTASIDAVTLTPDGQTVASSSEGGAIRVWNLQTLQEVHGFYQDAAIAIPSAAFAPDGMQLAVGGHDGLLRVWGQSVTCQRSVVAGAEQRCADVPNRFQGHTAPVQTVAWSFEGRYVATGGDDAQVIIWDRTANFAPVAKIAHETAVHSVSWSPGRQLLATASGKSVQIWGFQMVTSA